MTYNSNNISKITWHKLIVLIIVVFAVICIMLNAKPVYATEEVASGECGANGGNLTWVLDSDGILTISGEGSMTDYSTGSAPWYEYISSITEIVIDDGITGIGTYAFANCEEVMNVEIPDSVKSIGESSFAGCSSLTNITIPNNVTNIGLGAFSGCSSLEEIGIPFVGGSTKVIRTEVNLFGYIFGKTSYEGSIATTQWYRSSLSTTYYIPSSLTSVVIGGGDWIGDGAFYNCSCLTSVLIPDSVTEIGDKAFYNCSNLASIIIPDNVTTIESYSFYGCSNLASIIIPDNVTIIESHSFYGCSSLKSVVIGKSITLIANYAFDSCDSLNAVYINDISSWCGISFGSNPLEHANSLYINGELATSIIIPEGVTSIGNNAFYNCSSMTSITIPNSVTQIGYSAFYGCSNLNAVYINDISSWCEISFNSNPLEYANNLYIKGELATNVIIPDGVKSIGNSAFQNCSSIASIIIPNSVESIGNSAFKNCSGLLSITIPDGIKSIEEESFFECCNLEDISIPNTVTNIGAGSFYGCSSLTNITIPNGVTSINANTFSGCASLERLEIPDSVTSIYTSDLLSGCSSLEYLKIPFVGGGKHVEESTNEPIGKLFGVTEYEGSTAVSQTYNTSIYYYMGDKRFNTTTTTFYFPNNLKTVEISGGFITCGALSGCSMVKNIVLGDEVVGIGRYSFLSCGISNIVIPDGVSSLGFDSFGNCNQLESVSIPTSVTSVMDLAFNNCNNLNRVNIDSIEAWCNIDFDSPDSNPLSFAKNLYADGQIVNSITLSNSVKKIGRYAFCGFSNLKSIEIPDSIITIGNGAFSGCTGLKSIEIPDSILTIGSDTFADCTGLANILIPGSVIEIGDYAFSGCSNINRITLPSCLERIGNSAFNNCSSIKTINIPEGVSVISGGTFSGCTNLTSIILPEGIKSIGRSAFYNCTSLSSIVLPEGVAELGDYAFYNCNSLESIYISSNMRSIGGSVFTRNVTIYTTPNSYISLHCPGNCNICWICDEVTTDNNYLGFTTDTIVMKNDTVLSLSDYLISNYSLDECTVILSNEDYFMYDSGIIANLGSSQCDVTVIKDNLVATITIIAQSDDPSLIESMTFDKTILSMAKGEVLVNKIILSPINADSSNIEMTSSDESVVTINSGQINAVGAGTATVTARSMINPDIIAQCEIQVFVPLYNIIPVGNNPIVMEKGTTRMVSYYKYPSDTTDKIEYTSSNNNIAEIDANGRILAKGCGTAEVTISSGEIIKSVAIKVYIPISGLTLDQTSVRSSCGDQVQLTPIFEPEDTTERDITWASSKETVATIDENGLITIHGKGIATITATAGDYSATCSVVCNTHNWDKGKVTTEPTCTEEGVKTYACFCGETSNETIPALGHDMIHYEAKEPTCEEVGWDAYDTCSRCDYTTYVDIPATGHTPGEAVVENEVAATCLEAGSYDEAIYCSSCNKELSRNKKTTTALGHDLIHHEAKEPTCEEGGWDAYDTCSRCDYTTYSEIPATGHTPGEAVVENEVAATCLEAGSFDEVVYCSSCNKELSRNKKTIPALGHDLINHEAKATTCEEIGWEAYDTCSRCDYTTYIEIPAKGHTPVTDLAISPTCTETGLTEGSHCSVCGNILVAQEIIPATGHSWGEPTYIWSDDNNNVSAERVCANDPLHVESETVGTSYTEITPATETGAGVGRYTSEAFANEAFTVQTKDVGLPPTGYEVSYEWSSDNTKVTGTAVPYNTSADTITETVDAIYTVTKEPTCTDTGTGVWTSASFTNDQFMVQTKEVELEALGHNLTHYEAKEPTCEEVGWDAYDDCSRCDYTTYVEIPATGHTPGDAVVENEVAAKCLEEGSFDEVIYCSSCNKELSRNKKTIPALGHDLIHHEAKAPTCEEVGWETYETCSRCDYTTYEEIAALGHDFIHHESKAATCTESGWDEYDTCSRCDYTTYEEIAPLGHDYTSVITKATLTADGSIQSKCSRCGMKDPEFEPIVISHPATFTLSTTSYTYTGGAKKPTVTVKDSEGNTIASANYSVAYSNNIKVGTATAKVTFKGEKYSGTKSLTFKITPKALSETKISLNAISYTYDGNVKKPTVTVKDTVLGKTVTLVSGTDYTITYAAGRKNVGSYKVTIKGKGNYTGTVTKTFKINPKGTTLKSLTATSKGFKATWTKQATKMSTSYITGYQIQYSTSSTFASGNKTVSVTKYSTVSKTVSKLLAKKKYYVRIRTYKTVNGVKYYSPWSAKKYVTTKA